MTAATAAAVDAGHKVRGGSALSLALARASPADAPGYTTSPADSPGLPASLPASCGAGWLSSSLGSTQPASRAVGSCGTPAAAPASQQQGAQPPHSEAQQQHQPQPLLPPAPQRAGEAPPSQPHASHSRSRLLPFLGACFGGGSLPHSDSSVRPQPAVSASEVGIRPCFYWLHEDGPGGMNEAERMCAEANARWLKSDCQDDAVVIEHFGGLQHQTFAGVFDGHGPYGRAAAKFASTRLPQLLAGKAGAGAASERKRLRAMRDAFLEVHAAMQDISQAGFDASLSGTTACCVLVVGRKVLVASTGDSRCVVVRRKQCSGSHSGSHSHGHSGSHGHGGGGGSGVDGSSDVEVVPLTWDAKPSLPEEEKRIAQSGGVVKQLLDERGERVGAYRVFSRGDDVLPGLAMSRSLGDLYAHEVGVSPEPILNTYTLGERDLFLLLATDGLWDIMGNEQAADFVERYKSRRDVHVSCAEALTLEAQERWKALHNEAIVDDISCIILHTCGLPPPERDSSVPRPLARAASCNDEANELYWKWQREKERNPSNHRPKQYFKHLYGEEEDCGKTEAVEPAVPAVPKAQRAQQVAPVEDAVPQRSASRANPAAGDAAVPAPEARAAAGGAPPPTSPALVRDAPQACSSGSLSGAVPPALPSPAFRPSLHMRSPGGELGSSGTLHRMDDLSSQSPHSSYGDLASENSEPSMRRGSTYLSGAWGSDPAPILNRRSSSGPQPIPGKQRHGFGDGGQLSLPLESLLRPVRKAYPSTSNMQQLSYRSDGSFLAADTPRSGDGGELERKVRGGMSRSLSHACGLSSPLPASLPAGAACHVQASLVAWERSAAGRRSASSLAERGASSSSLGSPGGESVLLGPPSAPLSPQQSPLALTMGGGYSRVMVQPPAQQQHGPTRVQSVPFVHDQCAGPAGAAGTAGAAGAAMELRTARVVEVRAEMVQRGTHLSRTTTDTAGLVQAVDLLARAAAAAGMASGP